MAEYRWLKNYDPDIPHSLEPYPQKTLVDYLDDTYRERPASTMIIFKGRNISYKEIQESSDKIAAALLAIGLKKGDRVALIMPNCPQAITCRFGVWKIGGVLIHLNPMYSDSELEHALKLADVKVAIVMTVFYNRFKKIQAHTDVTLVIATKVSEYLPPLLKVLFTLFVERKDGHHIELQPGDYWLQALMRKHVHNRRPDVKVLPNDYAVIVMSGGTTGVPKGVIGTHYSQVVTGLQYRAWFGREFVAYKDTVMALMPLFHVFGNHGVLSTAMVAAAPISLVPDPRNRDDLIKTIQRDKPAVFPAVPALFISLLEHPQVKAGKVNFRSMRFCFSGASPLLAETKNRFESLTGGRIVEGYSLTEATAAAVVSPYKGKWKEGSVGLPLPDVIVRIGDIVTGEGDMPPGQEGEIVIKAPQLMAGYWNNPDETREILRDGWLYTGDVGFMDEDGYLFITSRKKDLIKPSGFQVWPREVEETISEHPVVAEVCVAGIPDPKQGEAVKAWIVLKADNTVTVEEIQSWCRERLAAYKIPRFIEFRNELPKTPMGKVLRRILVSG